MPAVEKEEKNEKHYVNSALELERYVSQLLCKWDRGRGKQTNLLIDTSCQWRASGITRKS